MPDLSNGVESPVIHLSEWSKATLTELAAKEGKSTATILEEPIEDYSRDVYFRA